MSEIRVRRAHPADARAMAEVQVAGWRAAYVELLPDWYLAQLSVERRTGVWEDLLPREELQAFVAEDQTGAVVGFASLSPSPDLDADPSTGQLSALYLLPSHWSRGIGRALLSAPVAAARECGFRRLTLWVLTGNRRARRFYEAAGFVADGCEKVEVREGGVRLEECRYSLEL